MSCGIHVRVLSQRVLKLLFCYELDFWNFCHISLGPISYMGLANCKRLLPVFRFTYSHNAAPNTAQPPRAIRNQSACHLSRKFSRQTAALDSRTNGHVTWCRCCTWGCRVTTKTSQTNRHGLEHNIWWRHGVGHASCETTSGHGRFPWQSVSLLCALIFRCLAIIWTNGDVLSISLSGTYFSLKFKSFYESKYIWKCLL